MHAPGVEVRPLRQMTGGASFNEVFFTEVRVPDDHRLGDVNNGWNVALTTLMNERAAIGAGGAGGGSAGIFARLLEMVKHYGLDTDPLVRQSMAELYTPKPGRRRTRTSGRWTASRPGSCRARRCRSPSSRSRSNMRRTAEFVSDVLGAKLIADSGEWGTYAWSQFVLGIPGMRIAGGTDEVMRNIVGERVLGLPKDAGIDSTSPVPRPEGRHPVVVNQGRHEPT